MPPSPCRKTIFCAASGRAGTRSAAIFVPSASSIIFGPRRGSGGGHGFGGALDVVAGDPPAGSSRLDSRQVDAKLSRSLARRGRGVDAATGVAGRLPALSGDTGAAPPSCRGCRHVDVATSAARSSSLRSSPGAVMTATAPITGTSLPTSATILRSTPLAGASTSSTAFSVSTVSSGDALRDRVALLAGPAGDGPRGHRQSPLGHGDDRWHAMSPRPVRRSLGRSDSDDLPHRLRDALRAWHVELLQRRAERHRRVRRGDDA